MNLVKCEKGHFYDADKFDSCPHCATAEDDLMVTVAMRESRTVPDDVKTEAQRSEETATMSLSDAIETIGRTYDKAQREEEEDDMGSTISYYSSTMGTESVVGWLVVLNGQNFGKGFALKAGRNFIGRAQNMDVILDGDETVSRNKHAIVVYEPKAKMFIAQPGESRELFYLNDKVVLNNEQFGKNDILLLGKTRLMLIPCCDEKFCWEDVENEE